MIRILNKFFIGIAHFAGLPGHFGPKMVEGATQFLSEKLRGVSDGTVEVQIESRRERNDNMVGAGSGLVLWAELDGGGIIGGSAVGNKKIDALVLGTQAAQDLLRGLNAGGCIDEVDRILFCKVFLANIALFKWLEDQIIIFMALAEGESAVRCGKGELQLHTRYILNIYS